MAESERATDRTDAPESADTSPSSESSATDSSTTEPQAETEASPYKTWGEYGGKFVTIRKDGAIAPNSRAYDEHFADAEAVQLKFNPETEVIGLKPIPTYDEDDRTHYRLGNRDSGGVAVRARRFLDHHGFDHDDSRRYRPEWDDEHGVLTVDPSEEGELVGQSDQ